jgi:hypothetical protein
MLPASCGWPGNAGGGTSLDRSLGCGSNVKTQLQQRWRYRSVLAAAPDARDRHLRARGKSADRRYHVATICVALPDGSIPLDTCVKTSFVEGADRPGAAHPLHDDRLGTVSNRDKGVELGLRNDNLSIAGSAVVGDPQSSVGGRSDVEIDWRWVEVDPCWDRRGQVPAYGIECSFGALALRRDLTRVCCIHRWIMPERGQWARDNHPYAHSIVEREAAWTGDLAALQGYAEDRGIAMSGRGLAGRRYSPI